MRKCVILLILTSTVLVSCAAPLEQRLTSSDDDVYPLAVTEFKNSSPTQRAKVIKKLANALSDPNYKVRESAAGALLTIGPEAKNVVPELVKALNDPYSQVRAYAAGTLMTLGSKAEGAVPELAKALSDHNDKVREYAASALKNIGPAAKSAVPELVKTLRDTNKGISEIAARALGRIGPEAEPAIPELVKMYSKLSSEADGEMQSVITESLRKIGPIGSLALNTVMAAERVNKKREIIKEKEKSKRIKENNRKLRSKYSGREQEAIEYTKMYQPLVWQHNRVIRGGVRLC